MFYVNEDLPFKFLQTRNISEKIEQLPIEINLGKEKLLIIGLYKPPNLKDDEFLSNLSDALNTFSISYNHITLIGDFNMTPENKSLTYFNNSSNFQHLISEPTCFKSIKPSQIDHILTNHKKSFMKSSAMETGISDFHKMIFTIIKYTFTKGKAKTLYYRNLKNINQSDFNSRLKQNINENDLNFDSLCSAIKESLNFFAPEKEKNSTQQQQIHDKTFT